MFLGGGGTQGLVPGGAGTQNAILLTSHLLINLLDLTGSYFIAFMKWVEMRHLQGACYSFQLCLFAWKHHGLGPGTWALEPETRV